jgi:hypothetical protein
VPAHFPRHVIHWIGLTFSCFRAVRRYPDIQSDIWTARCSPGSAGQAWRTAPSLLVVVVGVAQFVGYRSLESRNLSPSIQRGFTFPHAAFHVLPRSALCPTVIAVLLALSELQSLSLSRQTRHDGTCGKTWPDESPIVVSVAFMSAIRVCLDEQTRKGFEEMTIGTFH